ncbi:hypothetical protein GOQ27_12470 [Clostridium sp. D2Q-11]|uniref:Uncharacterized protein n=1 Tax=Anaeromonas frigoriresistens TaxID=2683708 RepID=A0A942UZS5_9FIRM|nr:hypothetical protein [Anaeromonas frigoriresistens]MBS4539281.1 hypothetical protein [Anaeromonas frigoriresistens]
MKKLDIQYYTLMLGIILFMSILPVLHIGNYSFPTLYLVLPIGALVLSFTLISKIQLPKVTYFIMLFFSLIIIEILISNIYASITMLDKFILPTDSLQYITRLLVFISFMLVFYKGKLEPDIFIKYFLVILNLGMLIGILQWLPWVGREFFIKLYPFRDGVEQLSHLNRPLHLIRVHGLAQHATGNGGLATFFFIFGYSVFKYYKKYSVLSISLMILSVLNIFASQARAGILALVFSLFLFYILDININKMNRKTVFNAILIVAGIFLIVWILYIFGNPFINHMVYRWKDLFNTSGGPRVEQAKYFFSLFKTPFHYLFGLSKPVVNQSDISYGVEIEPINIFILYGAIGFILQYTLIIGLAVYFIKRIKQAINNKAVFTLLIASFTGLISYQVFSVAYFFFREIRVGLFPWILMGVSIGVYERFKQKGVVS